MLILNPSLSRFSTHFLQMMHTLRLKNSLRGTMPLQNFIVLKLRKGERTVAMIKLRLIFLSKEHLHKNGKASPNSSEDVQLKPDSHGQAPVHGTYG